jgi:DNA-binding transcriptional regulator YdaS (Cro superfamily)
MDYNPVKEAISILRTEAALAEACGVTQPSINAAKQRGRPSAELAVKIEMATGGAVPRWKSRPDLWERPMEAAQ